MKSIKFNCRILVSLLLILMISVTSYAAVIYSPGTSDLEKYGPEASVKSGAKVELPEGTVVHDTPLTNTTINSETADQIKQVVIVGQGSNPAINQNSVEQMGPAYYSQNSVTGAVTITSPTPQDVTSSVPLDASNSADAIAVPTGINLMNLIVANTNAEKPKNISAPTYAIINASTNKIYDAKNQTEKYLSSGLANLMTAYIAASYMSMDKVLDVKATAVQGLDKDASIVSLRAGDKITLKDAIISMFVKGAVDAANVVAENVAGSKDAFVALMNTTAGNFGLQNTTFVDPAGILENNETTALDMAVIMARVCEKPELVELLNITQYTLPATNSREKLIIYNRNTMLAKEASSYNADVAGSRMAFTSKSKYCIASLMNYNNNKIIAVILKAEGTQFSDTKKLLEFAKIAAAE